MTDGAMIPTTSGCSKRPSRKAAASEEARRTLRYVEPLSEARTPLADFFSILLTRGSSHTPFLGESDFRFVVNFLKAVEAGEREPVDGDGTDFSYRRFVQGRPTAFFMNQRKHRCASWGFKDKPTKLFNLFIAAQSMIARNQIEFDRERRVARAKLLDKLTAPTR